MVLARDQDVGGLDVAMDQAALVGSVEGARDLGDEMGSTGRLERAAIDHLAQVGPDHPAHRDVEGSVLLARLVYRDDVGVVDGSGDHPLAPEPLSKRGVAGERRGHQLQRHRTREPQLGRAVDDSHPPAGGHCLRFGSPRTQSRSQARLWSAGSSRSRSN